LIAANKLDLFTALPAALVKSNLEAELGRVRKTRSKGLLDSGVGADDVAGEEGDDWLGEYGSEKFSFKQLLEFDIEVDVIGGNVVGDGPGVDKWWKWIAERI
jgi:signal recognition particle receptor subunit beta